MGYIAIADIRVDRRFERRLPEPGKKEFDGLVGDIRERGILCDLLVTMDGLLLDGHRRLRAAEAAGLDRVPVKRFDFNGNGDWEKTVNIVVNRFRKHLNPAQLALLGSTLLRVERQRAKERRRKGEQHGGRTGGKGRPKAPGHRSPRAKDGDRATQRVAEAVGVSRKTLERVEAVKKRDAERAQKLLTGELSVSSAYNQLRMAEIRRATEQEIAASPAQQYVKDLSTVTGRYRTVYMDLTLALSSLAPNGSVTAGKLQGLAIPELAHQQGCHFWIWTSWPMIREGIPHRLFGAWKLAWAGEIVWDKTVADTRQRSRPRTEVLLLAVSGSLPITCRYFEPIIRVKRELYGRLPHRFYELIEKLSPAPRIQLFVHSGREGWEWWHA